MHGEYKVPGGKLVVVDLEVVAGRLAQVALSGDFFLAPEETLEWMQAAVEGLAADSGEQEIASRVRAAAADAELLGITPEGVAIAVTRALAGGTQ